MNGIINVLKPPGMTSQNVVSYIKRILKAEKAGHTGTLDEGASGILPVCLGKATKISEYLLNQKKSYRAEMKIGYKSDTLDSYGKVEKLDYINNINLNDMQCIFDSFIGKIEQIPPMYSAIKYNGKRLYELARQGIELDRKSREVTIYKLDIVDIREDKILFDIVCSKGTYIRTICSDIGKALGTDAIMTFLIRTANGPFNIENSVTLDEINDLYINGQIENIIYPLWYAISDLSKVIVNESIKEKVSHGVGFKIQEATFINKNDDKNILIFDTLNNFLAMGKINNNYISIDKVFI